jgi:hypothetical protein
VLVVETGVGAEQLLADPDVLDHLVAMRTERVAGREQARQEAEMQERLGKFSGS